MYILPDFVTIIEVGPRDGLQNEKKLVSEENKLAFIHALQQAGIMEMELTSFVSPKWVPQMADAKNIMSKSEKIGRQLVLAPNAKGVELALQAGAKNIAVFVGVSDSFNRKNINQSTAESMKALEPVIHSLKKRGVFVRACISTAFYCPYEGKVKPDAVIELCQEFVSMGVDELSIADTIGMATPQESYTLFKLLKEKVSTVLLTAHFHDTRKMAIANIFSAMQAGINRFDTSAGGLGGCPFAPGATGNVATEDVVNMLERLNIETGVNVTKVCEAVEIIAPHLSRRIDSGLYTIFNNAKK